MFSNRCPAARRGPGFAVSVVVLAVASSSSNLAYARNVVYVADEDSLYAELERPENEGALLVLQPHTYTLKQNKGHCGQVQLLRDMGIRGSPGHRDAVVIDAGNLVKCGSEAKTGAIRVGRGSNSVEWLTVKGATNIGSAISTDLMGDKYETRVSIAHVAAQASLRGVDVRNFGSEMAGRTLDVELSDNVLTGNSGSAGQGLRLANINADGASIRATLNGNVSYDNVAGCLAANLNASNARIVISSMADHFDDNLVGCVLLGGLSDGSAPPAAVASHNTIALDVRAGSVDDNGEGVFAIGGQVKDGGIEASSNSVVVTYRGTSLANVDSLDIDASGAVVSGGSAAGNTVQFELRGVSKQAQESVHSSGSNTATVVRK